MATESQQNINTQADEISLKDLILKIRERWSYLLSKWMIILFFGMLGGALGFTYAYFKKPIYTATTTFVLEDEKGGGSIGGLAGLASMAGVDIGSGGGGGIFQGDNIFGLYRSRNMLEQTLLSVVDYNGKKQLLVDRYIEINNLRDKWKNTPKLLNLKFPIIDKGNKDQVKPDRLRDSILGVIVIDLNKNYLSVAKPDKKLSTIEVNVMAKDEFFAKAFNDELVKNVNEFYTQTKTKKTIQNVRILQNKTDSVRSVINGAIYNAVSTTDATPNLNPTRQVQRIVPVQRAQFSAETNKAILAELVKNLEMTKMSLLKEMPLIQIVDMPVYPLIETKANTIKLALIGFALGVLLVTMFLFVKTAFKKY